MKLSIAKDELQRGLGRIQSVVEKRNTMPILANVLMTASGDGRLELTATDLEVGIRGSYSASVDEAGSTTANAKKLYEIVRELSNEPVTIVSSPDAYLQIHCARAQFTLAGSAADEYPTLPSFTPENTARVQALLLAEMIDRTMYAASVDETRYNLNGVFFEYLADTGKMRMAATDGHRLAMVDRVLSTELEGLTKGVIIPRKGLAEFKRLLDEEDSDEFELSFEGNSGLVRKGGEAGVTLVMRLIEGEFPNYRQVIPKESAATITLQTEGLSHALRRVALLSAERSRAIKLEVSEGQLCLLSSNPDLGDAREEIDIDYAGDDISLAFNARYLMDALAATKAKEVRLSFTDATSPAQLVPTDDEDSLSVVMPMRA